MMKLFEKNNREDEKFNCTDSITSISMQYPELILVFDKETGELLGSLEE